jgi:hypothetical protein
LKHVRPADPRVYVLDRVYARLQQDWEYEVRGGESIWESAIKFTRNLYLE